MLSDYAAMNLALQTSRRSLDPNTRVGAVVVDKYGNLQAYGHNSLPDRISHSDERLANRDLKLKLIVHAEMNAILSAARRGKALQGSMLYFAASNPEGDRCWGGVPCTRCLVEILQAGIERIVSLPQKDGFSSWHADMEMSRRLIAESGIVFREMSLAELEPAPKSL